MRTIIMPKIDVGMETGRITKWLKKEGDEIKKDELIAFGISQKVTFEIVAPTSGTLYRILVPEGVDVPIGQIIAVVIEQNDNMSEVNKIVEEANKALLKKEETEEKTVIEKIKVSPLAKRLAREYNINLTKIRGTGPDGRIIKEDILRALEELEVKAKVPLTEPIKVAKVIPLTEIRRSIGEIMTLSYRSIPQVTLTAEVDATEINSLQMAYKETRGLKISYNAIFVKATAKALRDYMIFNSKLEGDQIKIFDEINIGLAVAIEDGLIVPVIHNADERGLEEIEARIRDIVERARRNELKIEDVSRGTFTITNLGMYGIEAFTPIIVPGQVAILGIGQISEKPRAINGKIVVKPTLTLSISFDHRVVDGAVTAKFLGKIKQLLEAASTSLIRN